MLRWGCCLCVLAAAGVVGGAESGDYASPNPELTVVRIDSAPTESFLAIKVDTTGRLFVGGREALFVYEPDDRGGYRPRQQLLKFPDHTWVYDIDIRGDDLYILTVSALYVIPNGRVQREGLSARRLVWGVPMGHVHQCFHGMTWGPEGDLYFAMGDPLPWYGDFSRPDHWGHWTFFSRPAEKRLKSPAAQPGNEADWVRTSYTGVGGVFRCRPDGSGFQVVATGLRNCCGLTFDLDWNLFTNDNDHESIPSEYVPGRLNYVTQRADFSWPRGWMLSKTPDRMDLLDTMNTSLGRFVPVGQTYYDDQHLPEKYRNTLLVARWCTRQITYYPLQHRGASFQCTEHELLAGRDLARPVHVAVGRGGRLFASICYMAHNEGSPVYKSDLVMITRADDPDDHPFEPYDAPTAGIERLRAELSSPAWSRRQAAHVELQRRAAARGADPARDLLPKDAWSTARADDPARKHLLWFPAALGGSRDVNLLRLRAASDPDPAIRLVAVRSFRDQFRHAVPAWRERLNDSDPQVAQSAVTAVFDAFDDVPRELVQGPARSADSYLRQPATLFMARKLSVDELGNMLQSGDPPARLAAVLAAGFRLTLPPPTGALPDDVPLVPWRNGDEAYKIHYIDGDLDLRDHARIGMFTVAEYWKASRHTLEQETLFALLAARLGDENEQVRLQAAHFLYLLDDERTEPVIARVRADVQRSRLATAPLSGVGTLWAIGPFPDGPRGFITPHAPEKGPFQSAAKFPGDGQQPVAWKQVKLISGRLFDLGEEFAAPENSSCYAFARIESGTKQQIELIPGTDDGIKVWLNGALAFRGLTPRSALPLQDVIPLELQPGSNDLLIRLRRGTSDCRLYLHYRALQPVAFVLPESLGISTLAERLKEAAANPDETRVLPEFLSVDWEQAAARGDAARGKKLFSADGLGCAKCHAATVEAAVTGGPSLADAAKRFTIAHLVESVLLPNKTISPVFKATTIVTKQGKTLTGLVTSDTAQRVEMILTDTNKVTLAVGEIEERSLQNVSPMPAGLVKNPDELSDLLAYLLGEK
ncbi:MAG: c-type cytochrome [Planctomycetales bacterium]